MFRSKVLKFGDIFQDQFLKIIEYFHCMQTNKMRIQFANMFLIRFQFCFCLITSGIHDEPLVRRKMCVDKL